MLKKEKQKVSLFFVDNKCKVSYTFCVKRTLLREWVFFWKTVFKTCEKLAN